MRRVRRRLARVRDDDLLGEFAFGKVSGGMLPLTWQPERDWVCVSCTFPSRAQKPLKTAAPSGPLQVSSVATKAVAVPDV